VLRDYPDKKDFMWLNGTITVAPFYRQAASAFFLEICYDTDGIFGCEPIDYLIGYGDDISFREPISAGFDKYLSG
jgi:quinol-cytochrome oxidoreductase complex cytochrome b subunit